MPVTTSLKLSDALKATIAKVAAFEGKTSHALMVDTLEAAMEDALARQAFYAAGEVAYRDTLRTNKVYRHDDVKAFVMSKIDGRQSARPEPVKFDPAKPSKSA